MDQQLKLIEDQGAELPVIPQEFEAIGDFVVFINRPPEEKNVLKNKLANNSLYIPIDIIERGLDEIYSGLWQTHSYTTTVVVNEIVGHLILEVFHPVAKIWLKRIGAAGLPIMQKKGSNIGDIDSKIKNTLVKDYPHHKAECLKNAAKSLGITFGRNLNRGSDEVMEPLSEKLTPKTAQQEEAIRMLKDSNLPERTQRETEHKILNFSDEQILSKIIPFISKNTTI